MKKIIFLLLTAIVTQSAAVAAPPAWSVNPGLYTYNMSAVVAIKVNCNEKANVNNMVGAFDAGGVCRGLAYTDDDVSGRKLAYLTVYSNVASGESLTMKFYDAVSDSVYDAKEGFSFTDNGSIGSNSSPFLARNNDAPTKINLSLLSMAESTTVGSNVSTLSAIDPDLGNTIDFSLVAGSNSTNNSYFTVAADKLVLNNTVNVNLLDTLKIRLRATDNFGCYYEEEFKIKVTNVNEAPTAINLSNVDFFENVSQASVGQFSAVDLDANDTFTYTLVNSGTYPDNASFSITANVLVFNGSANFESKNAYTISCRATDAGGLFTEEDFTITVKDKNDVPTNIVLSNNAVYENQSATQFVSKLSSIDEDVADSFTYTFSNNGTNNNTSFTISNDSLFANQLFDFETKKTYLVYLTTSDIAGTTFTKSFTISIKDSLDIPTDILISNNDVSENASLNTFIGKISTVDANLPGPNDYTYSLVSGIGSTNNGSFLVSNDSLFANVVFDYEIKKSYGIRLKTTLVNGMYVEKTFTVMVVNEIDNILDVFLSKDSIYENNQGAAEVGALSCASQDIGGVFTYNLVAGAGDDDNASFSIINNKLLFTAAANYESKNTYSVRLIGSNALSQTFEKSFIIKIGDANDKPSLVQLSNQNINENAPLNAFVGNCTALDEDSQEQFTFEFDNSVINDNAYFNLLSSGNLLTKGNFDYESKKTFNVSIKVTDHAGLSMINQFIIDVNDVNEIPVGINSAALELDENLPSSTLIGKFTTVDNDTSNTHTYYLAPGDGSDDNYSFYIYGDQLLSLESFNYETKKEFKIRVRSTDQNSLSLEKTFTVYIKNVNEAPSLISLSNDTLNDNASALSVVGVLTTTDEDGGNNFVYSLVSGAGDQDNASFGFDGEKLKVMVPIDYESKDSYSIRIRATDAGGKFTEQEFIITVKDLNDVSSDLILSNKEIYENEPASQIVATLSSIDQDLNDKFTYSFNNIGTNNNNSFSISNDTLRANQVFDFESKKSYVVYLASTDSAGASFTKAFSISIKDTLDIPADIAISSINISENAASKTFVGKLSTLDANLPGPNAYNYSLVAGAVSNDNSSFQVINDTLYSNVVFDYETKNSYTIRLKSTLVNNMFVEKTIAINIVDGIDTVQNILLSNDSIFENNTAAVEVGVLSSLSQDLNAVFTYKLAVGEGDEGNSFFSIINDKLIFTDVSNYEEKDTYSIRVSATNALLQSFEKKFLIKVIDANDKPTDLTLSKSSLSENSELNANVGNFGTIDADINEQFTYAFDNSVLSDNDLFKLLTTGQLIAHNAFDFETKTSYSVSVKTTDHGGLSLVKQFNVVVEPLNEAPVELISSVLEIDENKTAGSVVGSFSTKDVDASDIAIYSLVDGLGSDDNAFFTISNNELLSQVEFNYEQKSEYKIRIRTADIGGLYLEKSLLVNIKNINETPTLITLSKNSLAENTSDSVVVCALTTTDQEGGNSFQYALVAGSGDDDNDFFSVLDDKLILNKSANFEQKSSYKIRVRTSDLQLAYLDSSLSIDIIDVNEQPIILVEDYTVSELAILGAEIGLVTVTEPDNNQQQTFELLSPNVPFAIDAVTGMLTVKTNLNYESKIGYRILVLTKDDGNPSLSDTAEIKISVLDQVEENVFPSADFVSPNDDGKNDFWKITNVELYKDFKLSIMDEYGQIVYQIPGSYNNDWDAKLNGNALPTGSYYYQFINDAAGKMFKGIITVVK